jgi:CHAD domain-containing protein
MYKFDPVGEPVEAAFRSIAVSQLDEALAALGTGDADGRSVVHEARRRCKKLRGLLRLVRPSFADFATENAAIRDAAALLSHLRDAEVLQCTVNDLAKSQRSAVLEHVAVRLTIAGQPHGEHSEKLSQFRERLNAIRERAQHWSLSRGDWRALLPGLRGTYRSARRRMDKAASTDAATDFHEWRKASKNHGFHVDLLRRAAPELLADDLKTVEELATQLGLHHDLALLKDASDETPDHFGNAEEVAELRAAIVLRRNEVSARSLALGRQIFAE